MSFTISGAQVDHRCQLPTEFSNATFEDFKSNDSCHYYLDENDLKTKHECDQGYVYDKSTFGSSAVMDWNMVCDRKTMRGNFLQI